VSIWLPNTREGFTKLETVADSLESPVCGILISPSSHGSGTASDVANRYKDFTALVLDGQVIEATIPQALGIFERSAKLQEIAKRYPYRTPMAGGILGMKMVFYSEHPIRMAKDRTPTE
jgi:hypothetical protein